MATAVGNITGIVNMAERITGRIIPTASPYCHPQISPQKKTGRCMGKSIFPTSGICPVKNGSTMPMAINIAESTRFFKAECFIASLRGKI